MVLILTNINSANKSFIESLGNDETIKNYKRIRFQFIAFKT